jgi:hypothetical protein
MMGSCMDHTTNGAAADASKVESMQESLVERGVAPGAPGGSGLRGGPHAQSRARSIDLIGRAPENTTWQAKAAQGITREQCAIDGPHQQARGPVISLTFIIPRRAQRHRGAPKGSVIAPQRHGDRADQAGDRGPPCVSRRGP